MHTLPNACAGPMDINVAFGWIHKDGPTHQGHEITKTDSQHADKMAVDPFTVSCRQRDIQSSFSDNVWLKTST